MISRSKILCVVSQEALHKIQVVQVTSGIYKWCHSNNQVISIKMQDSSLNHLPQMHTFTSMRSTPFMEIDDKGGEIVQRYESFEIMVVRGERQDMKALGEIERLDIDMDKEGATLMKRDGSKIFNKRSTQVGGASS